MSAFVVLLDLVDQPVDTLAFDRTFAATADRVFDGSATWSDGQIAMGFRGLHADRSGPGEDQPVEFRGVVAMFDGRIDNRDELIAELGLEDLTETRDAALAVRAFSAWGHEAAERILGDFGFVAWDRKRQTLLVARDCVGTRPVYHWSNGRILVVATDLRSILAHPSFRADPDEARVADALCWDLTDDVGTLYRGVNRLPPGHYMVAANSHASIVRYWDIDLSRSIRYSHSADYVDHLVALLDRAVSDRLRTSLQPFVSLSGGLDSSLVAALAGTRAAALSTTYPGLDCDESEWIRLVTEHTKAEGREIPWKPMTWEEVLSEAARTRALPPYPNMSIHMFARSGVSRGLILSGGGGDELMNGHDVHYRDLVTQRHPTQLVRQLLAGGAPTFVRRLGGSVRFHVQRLRPVAVDDDQRWLGRALRSIDRTRRSIGPEPNGPKARVLRYGIFHAPWESHCYDLTDQATSAAALVYSDPFYDRRVIEWAFAIPENERWRGGDRRWLERRALRGRVPESVAARRGKVEFSDTFRRQLAQVPFDDLARTSRLAELGWVDKQALRNVTAEVSQRAECFDATLRAWSFVAVETWYRTTWA